MIKMTAWLLRCQGHRRSWLDLWPADRDSRRNIQQINDGMAWWRANLIALDDELANLRRLMDDIRRTLAIKANEG
jgi:hypothetical protein